jgi:hypothetical protein
MVPRHRGNPVIFSNVTDRWLRFVRGQWFATPEQARFRVSAPALGPRKVAPAARAAARVLSIPACATAHFV